MGRLAVAVLVALGALLIATGAPLAPWLDRVSGAEARAVFDVTLPPGADAAAVEATWRARLPGRVRDIAPGATPERRVVTVAGDRTRQQAAATADALSSNATLEVREVRADTPTMRALFAALHDRDGEVGVDVDSWRSDATGELHTDYVAYGPSAEAVDAAIVEALDRGSMPQLADDEEIVYETIVPLDEDRDARPFVRSYVVGGAPVITGADVADTVVLWDEMVERPEVGITLTDEGARRFGEATSRHVGGKLAFLIDGTVHSAPIIEGAIIGGRTNLSVGRGTPDEQQAEADALATMLRGGRTLPPGIRAALRELAPASAAKRWAARGGLTLVAGVLAWVIATLIARATTPAPQVVPTRRGGGRDLVVPIAVTALGLAAIEYLSGVFLPGLSLPFRDLVDRWAHIDDARRFASPVALGTVPVVSAYLLVELVAWATPALRARRVGTGRDRAPLELAVALLAFGFALVQSYFTLKWFRVASGEGGIPALDEGALVQVGIVASLVGGVALQAVLAQLITRHGLCNGWLVLVAYDLLRQQPHDAALAGLVLLGAVIAVGLTARRPTAPDTRRLPVSGLVPAALLPTILGVLALPYVVSLWYDADVTQFLDEAVVQIGFACGLATLLSLRRGTPATVAVVTSIGMSAIIAGVPFAFPEVAFREPLLAGAIAGVLCAELAEGARRRLYAADTIALVAIHDVERADEYVDLLRSRSIPASPTGARARGLYRGLGAFVPVTIHVPRDRAEEAAALLRLPPSRPSAPPPPPSAATGG